MRAVCLPQDKTRKACENHSTPGMVPCYCNGRYSPGWVLIYYLVLLTRVWWRVINTASRSRASTLTRQSTNSSDHQNKGLRRNSAFEWMSRQRCFYDQHWNLVGCPWGVFWRELWARGSKRCKVLFRFALPIYNGVFCDFSPSKVFEKHTTVSLQVLLLAGTGSLPLN